MKGTYAPISLYNLNNSHIMQAEGERNARATAFLSTIKLGPAERATAKSWDV